MLVRLGVQARRLRSAMRQGVPALRLGVGRLLGRRVPYQVTLSLTNRCNFRCEYCHIPLQARDEMTTAEWCAAIDELRAAGMGRASLIGGEPLLRDDLRAIIEHLKSGSVHVAMNTNGWHVAERIEEIADLDLVCVTLDGPPAVHDRQRHPGSHARALEAITVLQERRVPVVTMTVVTPQGAGSVDYVLERAVERGFRAFFQLEHDAGCDVDAPLAPRLDDALVRDLAWRLIAHKDAGLPVGNSRPVLEELARDRYLGTCADCYAGRYLAYVLCDGTVAPCLLTQAQVEQGGGRSRGFARAFAELGAPQGPGCACVPIHEVNRILDFDLRSLREAFTMVVEDRVGRGAGAR